MNRIVGHRLLALLTGLSLFGAGCGGDEKKKPKEPPLEPLKIAQLEARFDKDIKAAGEDPATTRLSFRYRLSGAKLIKDHGVYHLKVTAKWRLLDAEGQVLWERLIKRHHNPRKLGHVLDMRETEVGIGKLLPEGSYQLEIKEYDRNSDRRLVEKVTLVKTAKMGLPKPPARPEGYATLDITKLHVKLPKGGTAKVMFKSDDVVFLRRKRGSVSIVPAKRAISLASHVKITESLGSFKGWVSKKGPGAEWTTVHKLKLKRKRLYILNMQIRRRGKTWLCIGRSKRKKSMAELAAVCESLK